MPRFTDYTDNQLGRVQDAIFEHVYTKVGDLEITAYCSPEPLPFPQRRRGKKRILRVGDTWGKLFECAWFHFRGTVPKSASGKKVVLLIDVNGELCVFDSKGVPARGLTCGSSVFADSMHTIGKRVLPFAKKAKGGARIDLWADAGCNGLFGNLRNEGKIDIAAIAICNDDMRDLAYDFRVLLDFWKAAPRETGRSRQMRNALQRVAATMVEFSPEEVRRSRQILAPTLSKKGGDAALHVSAIGHAHLDLAWLWPERETWRKGARTFATVLELMERYPDYQFGASQPQLFLWMKNLYPALYRKIKRKVKEGRIEPQGAMWVESDTNIPCGESLVRQLLYGKRFYEREFGVEMDYLWLPDVFGYSAALPQILRLADVKYFMTQKLSWSTINRFPHHSFRWQGIDGTQVLTHMLPEDTYNSSALPRSLAKIDKEYLDGDVSDEALMLFGIGDGGGGPGAEHLESLKRIQNLAGLPPVRQEPVASFFPRWAKDAEAFATWVGELYLERHQGTFTTHGRIKWYNRRIEQALRELEWTAACARIVAGKAYPRRQLLSIWQRILCFQFHDILPGSSIKRVYDECKTDYSKMLADIGQRLEQCRAAIARRLDTQNCAKPWLVSNSLSWSRTEWLKLGRRWTQVTTPAMSFSVVDAQATRPEIPGLKATPRLLENDRLRVRFHQSGAINSIYDKVARREVLAKGALANRLTVYQDKGNAWDFPMDYADKNVRTMHLVSSEAKVDGPRAAVRQRYTLGHSVVDQEILLMAGSPLLEFATRATWRDTETMLRTSFPVDILADRASYEIQFGSLERPTHRNTSWDLARDEVPAQKWVDLSQRDYGVALVNDSKYGHKVKDNILDLNLLRSVPHTGARVFDDSNLKPGEPNYRYTDQEDHEFRYGLYPHQGDYVSGGVVRIACEFNIPLHTMPVAGHRGDSQSLSMLHVDSAEIVVEAVKMAEDRDSMIVRLYESSGSAVDATLSFGKPVNQVHEVGIMENAIGNLKIRKQGVPLRFGAFQIRTLEVEFK
ncbi:MAG: glycoside hydrolase family 38 C-terminal domain-containing protein [Kiritimatiellia bacterium]|jgi:alpha-mannosidase|nr:glycoside hydrolase family 38 C-terminal domain-containing protein [Kiritimatiellia bacterium]